MEKCPTAGVQRISMTPQFLMESLGFKFTKLYRNLFMMCNRGAQ